MRNFALITLLLFSVNCWAEDKGISVETIATIKHAVVPVVCAYPDENQHYQIVDVSGTGFFVDTSGRFVTADHVLDGWPELQKRHPCVPAVYIPIHGWGGKFEKNIVSQFFFFVDCVRDHSLDLAVCALTKNPFDNPYVGKGTVTTVSFDTAEQFDGTPVAFTGFPIHRQAPITAIGYIGGMAIISPQQEGFDYFVDVAAWPGASGSPLYTSDGRVIGIIRAGGLREGEIGLSLARNAALIVDFLSKNPPKTQAQKQGEQKQ